MKTDTLNTEKPKKTPSNKEKEKKAKLKEKAKLKDSKIEKKPEPETKDAILDTKNLENTSTSIERDLKYLYPAGSTDSDKKKFRRDFRAQHRKYLSKIAKLEKEKNKEALEAMQKEHQTYLNSKCTKFGQENLVTI